MKRNTLSLHACAIRYVSILLSLTALTSCVDLKAIRDFAGSATLLADHEKVADDFATEVERQRLYEPQNGGGPTLQDRKDQKKKFVATQKILAEYMATLAALAAEELPDVSKDITSLTDAIKGSEFISKSDADAKHSTLTAAGNIAGLLTTKLLDAKRQRVLCSTVSSQKQNVRTVIDGLTDVAKNDFAEVINDERGAANSYFNKINTRAADTVSVRMLTKLLRIQHDQELASRDTVLRRYVRALQKIGKGHDDLAANVCSKKLLNSKSFQSQLKGYAKDLKSLYEAISELR